MPSEFTRLERRIAALEKLSNERHVIQLTIRKAAKSLALAERDARTAMEKWTRGVSFPRDPKQPATKTQIRQNAKLMTKRVAANKKVEAARHHLYMTILDVPLK